MISKYNKAKEELLTNQDLASQQFFVKNGYILEDAYCELLKENITEAKKLFSLIKDTDTRAHWALIMISMIEGTVKEYPTYFELRNFLEIDLNILISYLKGNYVENIVRYSDFMFTINPEVYKFIGRVLYNNNFPPQAMFFLERAKSYFYNDPELHYLLAFIFYNNGEFTKAKAACLDCLRILPEYFPAVNMLKKVS